MIQFTLNGISRRADPSEQPYLLSWLRLSAHITSPKDGCSGEGVCGACTVEINGKPALACRTKLSALEGAEIYTTEGLPASFRQYIGEMFALHGAVQCGFCTPGFIMRSRNLFLQKERPDKRQILRAINPNLCRCTGYIKIIEAIEKAWDGWQTHARKTAYSDASIGSSFPKYQAVETALGQRPFVNDLHFEGMLHAALVFSHEPRARIVRIDTSAAKAIEGVAGVFTAADIPGKRYQGLIFNDWPIMRAEGEVTAYIGDVLAVVVASSEALARKAAKVVKVNAEPLAPITDVHEAALPSSPRVHHHRTNVLEVSSITNGNTDKAFNDAAYISGGIFETQRIEHAFLETETAIAVPDNNSLELYSQGQGVYVDRKQVAGMLGIDEQKIVVHQVQNGGGFGGKEDLTVQGHASLCAWLLQKPVRVHLNRAESIRMHPKRHPVWMKMELACNKQGQFTGLRLKALGDTGAYASVGTKVMERVVGHATGGYEIQSVDIEARTVYTNNIPSGAMRGFGVPQVVFALESCIDDLCRQGGFNRWDIRFANALDEGSRTAAGQRLKGVGLKMTLEAVKETFNKAKYAGIACSIKNTGVGNAMIDESKVAIEFVSPDKVIIHHGWTEMGQGIHTMAIQVLHQETGIDPAVVQVRVNTNAGLQTGMTTSSRATALLGNAIIQAAVRIRDDMGMDSPQESLHRLQGRTYKGAYICDWTVKPGSKTSEAEIHFAYGYATQVVILDDNGKVQKVVAAHDAGKVMNRMLFEGQIEGAVHMGLGYALSENLPMQNGQLRSDKMKNLGIIRATNMPEVEVIGIEKADPYGPYGAKGIGEIGMVPTAAAVACAMTAFDGKQRFSLPLVDFEKNI